MTTFREWMVRLWGTLWPNPRDRELEEELTLHLEMVAEEARRRGESPEAAMRAATLQAGGVAQAMEALRDQRGLPWLEDFVRDCRYGLRVLRRSPVFTSVAILSLALGIGATTAIFSLMDRIMFRMLPVRAPETLVEIGPCCLSYPLFQDLKQRLTSLDGVFGYAPAGTLDIVIDGQAETADIDMASGSYYSLLGVSAVVGRTFAENVDRVPGASPVAVISHRYWQTRFASDPAVIGKTFQRLNTAFTIIGVTPPAFHGVTVGREFDITVPIAIDAQARGGESWQVEPTTWWVGLIGRLKPGTGMEQAGAELRTVLSTEKFAPNGRPEEMWKLRAASGGFDDLAERVGKPLTILMGIVSLVLLLACANLANLLLTRSAVRQREIAVRLAIGAGRGRVIRQLLAEGLLLAIAGGTIGVVLAYAFADNLVAMMSNYGPRIPLDVRPNARVLLFAAAVSMVASTLFSLAPALVATKQSFQPVLAEIRATRWRLGKGLLVAQMAMSIMLLIGAGLFARTLIKLYAASPGFEKHGVVLFSTNALGLKYGPQRLHGLQTDLLTRLNALPGVESATISAFPPINRGSWRLGFVVEGGLTEDNTPEGSLVNAVGPDFFHTLRAPLVAGREFHERDAEASPRVAIVNEAFAKSYFQDRSSLGRWLAMSRNPDQRYEIVGVVQGYKYTSLRRDVSPTVYLPAAQVPGNGVEANTYFLRTDVAMAGVVPSINALLRGLDKALRPMDVMTLEQHVAKSVLQERMLATLAVFFGGVALLLGGIGIYGVMAFQVARRRREIGIRMALGADPRKVVRMILSQAVRLTLVGCVIGAAGGSAFARLTEAILYGVHTNDPATFVGAITVVVLVALTAAYLPARSAARINPVEALKYD